MLGDPERTDGEVVEMTNPMVGTHRKLVVRDGVIVAAALVGDLSRVGLITQLYDRRTVLGPHEPGELLAPEGARPRPPSTLADDAEVCACAGVTAGRIRACAGPGARSARTTRATTGCGGCGPAVRDLLEPAAAASAASEITRNQPESRFHGCYTAKPAPSTQSAYRRRTRRDTPMTHLRKTLVVVGNGMVGHRFVQAAIERGLTETYDVVVVGEEPRPAYDRVALTSFFAAGSADELSLLPEGAYDDPRVRLLLGHHGRPGSTARRAHGHAVRRRGARVRRAGAGHRGGAVRAAGPGPRPGRLLRLPHHRGPRGDPGRLGHGATRGS